MEITQFSVSEQLVVPLSELFVAACSTFYSVPEEWSNIEDLNQKVFDFHLLRHTQIDANLYLQMCYLWVALS